MFYLKYLILSWENKIWKAFTIYNNSTHKLHQKTVIPWANLSLTYSEVQKYELYIFYLNSIIV